MAATSKFASDLVEDLNLRFVLTAIKNCDTFTPDWNSVAKEVGIGYGKNAASKFKAMAMKHGFKLEKGVVTKFGGNDGAEAGANVSTTSTNGAGTPAAAAAAAAVGVKGKKKKQGTGKTGGAGTPGRKKRKVEETPVNVGRNGEGQMTD